MKRPYTYCTSSITSSSAILMWITWESKARKPKLQTSHIIQCYCTQTTAESIFWSTPCLRNTFGTALMQYTLFDWTLSELCHFSMSSLLAPLPWGPAPGLIHNHSSWHSTGNEMNKNIQSTTLHFSSGKFFRDRLKDLLI